MIKYIRVTYSATFNDKKLNTDLVSVKIFSRLLISMNKRSICRHFYKNDSLLFNCDAETCMDKKILDLIRNIRIGHLATASANLQPYLTPVVFVIEQKSIFIPLDDKPKTTATRELKRVKNITENPRVSFLVDHYEEDWKNLWFVMLIGYATLIHQKGKYQTTKKQIIRIRSMLVEKYSQYTKIGIGNLYIKIRIDKSIYWKFSQSRKNGSICKPDKMISSHFV
jgi:PPOX class probable F420-dependent enzyme